MTHTYTHTSSDTHRHTHTHTHTRTSSLLTFKKIKQDCKHVDLDILVKTRRFVSEPPHMGALSWINTALKDGPHACVRTAAPKHHSVFYKADPVVKKATRGTQKTSQRCECPAFDPERWLLFSQTTGRASPSDIPGEVEGEGEVKPLPPSGLPPAPGPRGSRADLTHVQTERAEWTWLTRAGRGGASGDRGADIAGLFMPANVLLLPIKLLSYRQRQRVCPEAHCCRCNRLVFFCGFKNKSDGLHCIAF